MASKSDFAGAVVGVVNTLATVADVVEVYRGVYFDNEWQPAGNDPITDNNLDGVGITATELGNALSTLNSLSDWLDGATVTPADNRAVLNKVREQLPRT